jgi:hypothetical protein
MTQNTLLSHLAECMRGAIPDHGTRIGASSQLPSVASVPSVPLCFRAPLFMPATRTICTRDRSRPVSTRGPQSPAPQVTL